MKCQLRGGFLAHYVRQQISHRGFRAFCAPLYVGFGAPDDFAELARRLGRYTVDELFHSGILAVSYRRYFNDAVGDEPRFFGFFVEPQSHFADGPAASARLNDKSASYFFAADFRVSVRSYNRVYAVDVGGQCSVASPCRPVFFKAQVRQGDDCVCFFG